MFAVWLVALLCLTPLSQAAPLDCGALVKPLAEVDLDHYQGKWVLVADSINILQGGAPPIRPRSVVVRFTNSSITQGLRLRNDCTVTSTNVSRDGPNCHAIDGTLTVNGTVYQTSCRDCVLMRVDVDSPFYKSKQVSLFSRRREVQQEELEEFKAQLECLEMPQHVVMDPNAELCL